MIVGGHVRILLRVAYAIGIVALPVHGQSPFAGAWHGTAGSGHAEYIPNPTSWREPLDPRCGSLFVTMQNVQLSIIIEADGTIPEASAVADHIETSRCSNAVQSDQHQYSGTGTITNNKIRLQLAASLGSVPEWKGIFTGQFKNGRLNGWLDFSFNDGTNQWVTQHKVALAPAPRLLSWVAAGYTDEARAARLQGVVVLSVQIDSTGQVINSKVLRSLGLGLDENAVEASKKWKFIPLYKNGLPIPTETTIDVRFELDAPDVHLNAPVRKIDIFAPLSPAERGITLTLEQKIADLKDSYAKAMELINKFKQTGNLNEADAASLRTNFAASLRDYSFLPGKEKTVVFNSANLPGFNGTRFDGKKFDNTFRSLADNPASVNEILTQLQIQHKI